MRIQRREFISTLSGLASGVAALGAHAATGDAGGRFPRKRVASRVRRRWNKEEGRSVFPAQQPAPGDGSKCLTTNFAAGLQLQLALFHRGFALRINLYRALLCDRLVGGATVANYGAALGDESERRA